jgi:hypothetical protein
MNPQRNIFGPEGWGTSDDFLRFFFLRGCCSAVGGSAGASVGRSGFARGSPYGFGLTCSWKTFTLSSRLCRLERGSGPGALTFVGASPVATNSSEQLGQRIVFPAIWELVSRIRASQLGQATRILSVIARGPQNLPCKLSIRS